MHYKLFSTFAILFATLMLAGTNPASAADVHLNVGVGGGHAWHGGRREFRTYDSTYGTWYPNDGGYVYTDDGYTNGYYNSTYVQPYVYATPSVEFGSWYGGGYSNHGGYSGGDRGGYGGGSRGGRGGGSAGNGGGGHSGGGGGGRR